MKFLFLFLFVFAATFAATDFNKTAGANAVIAQDGDGAEFCPVCGMKLKAYYKTSHASHLQGGHKTHYCSMRCLLVDSKERNASLDDALVADAKTDVLIPAKSAFYVVGSDVKGTMASVSKLAFSSEADAVEFSKVYGGEIKDFNATLELARSAIAADNAAKKDMQRKKIHPMGEKVYKSKCAEIDVAKFPQINLLKDEIYRSCKDIKESEAQPVVRYLWDVVRTGADKKVVVTKDDKCPVCGMFVHKHEGWAAKIYAGEKYFAFDGVKDMMKFALFSAKFGAQNFDIATAKFEVSDYYHGNAIDAKSAFYVVGSDVFGPMGDELIAFASEADAKAFANDHKAKAIYKFQEITSAVLCALDGTCRE